MEFIEDILEQILPLGSNPASVGISEKDRSWKEVPRWPPDLFAVVATIIDRSGCYSDQRYSCKNDNSCIFGRKYLTRVRRAANSWNRNGRPPGRANSLWKILIKNSGERIISQNNVWRDAVVELLAIADETSAGIGFYDGEDEETFARLAHFFYLSSLKNSTRSFLNSVCIAVPQDTACVQPKTDTSQVGCTLRSLSHHLCLLPGIGKVKTNWNRMADGIGQDEFLNLILVPFPYNIQSNSFRVSGDIDDDGSNSGHFSIDQTWLPIKDRINKVADFLSTLISAAESEVGKIHGVVLPEIALKYSDIVPVSQKLQKHKDLEFFVSGVLEKGGKNRLDRNLAHMTGFTKNQKNFLAYSQSKHHRWRLDRNQIKRYQLENVLDTEKFWWEEVDISGRQAHFYVFRPGASMAVLVCEDLARIDPIQPVLRSVGPNLVIALLQDGPQLLSRWSNRYATVLADDPGSSVLCLTSLGMVKRSQLPSDSEFRNVVALWKDHQSGTTELTLKEGEYAIALSLKVSKTKSWTLDGRSCAEETRALRLDGAFGIKPDIVPKWL